MERPKEIPNENTSFLGLDIGGISSPDSFQRLLDSQKELFHSQIDQLNKIVVTQCKLTGVNPLSQEMAAGALSIKIGKRPKDLLNPKAIKYMQSVFSFKDAVTKREAREISARFGVTVMQVREFFSTQRTRVRKLVQLSHDMAIRLDASKASHNGLSTNPDDAVPVSGHASENFADVNTVGDAPSCSSQEEIIPGIESSDKNFLENIFNLMRKEDTFSGQVKLMEWILQIHNTTVLYWFLTKGGIMILAKWLSQAAVEEQTTVLLIIFKVLCHLPLHRALPLQMSAILQTVNRLRFYRTSDISNRARNLLSRWSKLFVRSQALRKPSEAEKEIIRKQRISEILSDEAWQSKIEIPEEIHAFTDEISENCRQTEPLKGLKLLTASCDDSNKKQTRSVSSPQTKERRKVLLVEQPGRKLLSRAVQISRAAMAAANTCRPMSADDIQKAKMRAIFMHGKHHKDGGKNEVPVAVPARRIAKPLPDSKNVRRKLEKGFTPVRKLEALPARTTVPEPRVVNNVSSPEKFQGNRMSSPEKFQGNRMSSPVKFQGNRIPWHTPPEMRINRSWRIGAGEKSNEVEIQTERIRREKETIYRSSQEIPADPRKPWDVELDFDDTLTPAIPTDQPSEPSSPLPTNEEITASSTAGDIVQAPVITNPAEPDLELLAVLLKNPELVFALTSGQGKGITNAETVALLDLLKSSNTSMAGILNGMTGMVAEKSPAIKPEVTPVCIPAQSDPALNQQRSESAALQEVPGDSVLQRNHVPLAVSLPSPSSLIPAPMPENRPSTSFTARQFTNTSLSLPQAPITSSPMRPIPFNINPPPQLPRTSPAPEKLPVVSLTVQQTPATCSIKLQIPVTGLQPVNNMQAQQLPNMILAPQRVPANRPDAIASGKHFPVTSSTQTSLPSQNFLATGRPMQQPQSWNSGQTHIQSNTQKTTPAISHPNSSKEVSAATHLPALLPTPARQLPPLISEPPVIRPAWIHNLGPSGSPEIGDHRLTSGLGHFRHTGNQVPSATDSGGRPKILLEDFRGERAMRRGSSPLQNSNYPVNRINSNAFPAMQPPLLPYPPGEPELEMWSPERSPEWAPEFSPGPNWHGSRREFSPGWRGPRGPRNSRPWRGQHGNRHGNRWHARRY